MADDRVRSLSARLEGKDGQRNPSFEVTLDIAPTAPGYGMKVTTPLQAGLLNAAIGFVAVVTLFATTLPQGWNGWYRLSQSGIPGRATVLSCQQAGKHQRMTYEYTVSFRQLTGRGMGCDPGPGGTVAIVYLAADPSVSASAFDQDKMKWAPLIALGFPALLGISGYWLATRRLRMGSPAPSRR